HRAGDLHGGGVPHLHEPRQEEETAASGLRSCKGPRPPFLFTSFSHVGCLTSLGLDPTKVETIRIGLARYVATPHPTRVSPLNWSTCEGRPDAVTPFVPDPRHQRVYQQIVLAGIVWSMAMTANVIVVEPGRLDESIEQNNNLIVDCWADWCG